MSMVSSSRWIHAFRALIKGPPKDPLRERVAEQIAGYQERVLQLKLDRVALETSLDCAQKQEAVLRSWISDQSGVQPVLAAVR
jgi:hypothetical protein